MILSPEVLQNIAFSEKMGFDKLDQLPPAETREKMKQFPKNPDIHGFLGTGEMGLDAIQIICDFLIDQFKGKKEPIGVEQRQVHS